MELVYLLLKIMKYMKDNFIEVRSMEEEDTYILITAIMKVLGLMEKDTDKAE